VPDRAIAPAVLTALTLPELTARLAAMGLPDFRARQIWKWVWRKGADGYEAMTDLPAALRSRLAAELPVHALSVTEERRSKRDGTVKALLTTRAGLHIESVAMPDEETGRMSICVSTQIGCAMGCRFCASAVDGLKGQLSCGEMLDQVLIMSRLAGGPASNVVLMGMGEPLANYDNCLEAVRRLNSKDWLEIGARRITLSTVGLADRMARMVDEWPPVSLAVSLHAPNDLLRRKIIPAAARFTIVEILEVASAWAAHTSRRFTVEYVLIADVNSGRSEAEELAVLLRRRPAKVNLIALNPGGAGKYDAPVEGKVLSFRDVLAGHGLEVTIRKRRGTDIEAACGQLRLRRAAGEPGT
jgi:23S rRNA (adenine2503-C2)-methyltransferase